MVATAAYGHNLAAFPPPSTIESIGSSGPVLLQIFAGGENPGGGVRFKSDSRDTPLHFNKLLAILSAAIADRGGVALINPARNAG